MSSAHAPQNLPADLNESSQQNAHELADGCDDADTYLSASFVFFLISRKNRSLVFFFVMGVVGAHVGFNGNRSNRSWVFFVPSRPRARPEDVGFARRETRRARCFAAFCCSGRTKSGRCARVLVAVGLFSSAFFSLRDLVTKGTSKGRVSGAFSAKKKKRWWTQNLTKSIVSF